MTERTKVSFVCKRGADDDKPFIVLEPVVESLTIQEKGFIHFDLAEGTTDAEAESIRELLDSKISAVGFTRF